MIKKSPKTKNAEKDLVIYQAKSGAIEMRTDVAQETIWITQKQMGEIFDVDVRTVNEHLKNIFKTAELDEKSVIRKFRITAADGKMYNTNHYNLDAILSVGYRVNSKVATRFRQWATKTLRQHIVEGFTINRSRIAKNYEAFLKAVKEVQTLLPTSGVVDARSALELISLFAHTWVSLDAYDTESLPSRGATKKQVYLTSDELGHAFTELRDSLSKNGSGGELFGKEREEKGVERIVASVLQSFDGKDVYPTVEEKAAHLLYFFTKNHLFFDGNKRHGAFAFIWFLKKARLLDTSRLSPEALTALTLLVAESDPKDKERVVGLILLLLRR